MIERGGTGGYSSSEVSAAAARIERVPPHSLEAEMAVLGSALIDGDVIGTLIPIIKSDDFYRSAHGRLYDVMLELYDRGEPIDALLVFREIERQGAFDQVGGADYLATLDHAVASPANAEHYARIVREKAIARSLISATTEIQQAAYAEEGRGDDLLEMAEREIFELGNRRDVQGAKNVKSLLNETFEELERGDGPVQGIESGFYQFDEMTTGLRPGELIIVAARPSMGKTSLALNIAMNAAIAGNKNVAVYSLEMTAQNIVRNMLCAKARFSGHDLRKGRFIDDSRRADLAQAAGPLFEAGIFIDDSPTLNPSLLRAKARRLKAKHGLDLVLVDYLQLMDAGRTRGIDNRQQEISYISRSLKGLARELNVPVIALSQLNRDAEKRPDNKPKLADLRECVVGDTPVLLADGRRVPIRDLVGQTPDVLAMDQDRRIIRAQSEVVWSVGEKPVHRLRLASGRELIATAKHRLYCFEGWRRLGDLQPGDRVAVARLMPQLVGAGTGAGTYAAVADSPETSVGVSRDPGIADYARDDLFWDRIVSIEPAGEEEVFDLTVPGPSSWLADGVVSHNSGAIEQDADVICLLFRKWYYSRQDTDKNLAELIIAKQRNGPTGTVNLHFFADYMLFTNPSLQPM